MKKPPTDNRTNLILKVQLRQADDQNNPNDWHKYIDNAMSTVNMTEQRVNFMCIHKTRIFAKIILFQIAEEHNFQIIDKVLLQNIQGKTKKSNKAEKRWLDRHTISGQNKSDIFSSESQKGQQKHHGFFFTI